MYKITYFPVANQDEVDTVRFISEKLQQGIAAALALINNIERTIAMLVEFPHAHPIHSLHMKLPRETCFLVRNYLLFSLCLNHSTRRKSSVSFITGWIEPVYAKISIHLENF